jgi:hypothetical protein
MKLVVRTGSPAGKWDVETVTAGSHSGCGARAGAAGRVGLAVSRCTAAVRLRPQVQHQAASPAARLHG